MTLSEELQWRGLVKDKTFKDFSWLDTPRTFYLGSDAASADSLTIGNLAVYMLARHLAEHGWKTVFLFGGATSLIGDPGGKDEERQLKSREEISHNVAAIRKQVTQLFAGNEFDLVDNYDWFKGIGYLEFLREVGKHYSMTELVQRDFISQRMGEGGSGISYAEFSYGLVQGYDFWWLFKNKGVELQIGGSDQWGNMLSGVPLVRKKEGREIHALSMPLVINKATGKKFGKSEDGAVWLDPAKTSPTQFYQFWINCDDQGVEDYLKIYTMLPRAEIESLVADHKQNPRERKAQVALAEQVTQLVHGHEQTKIARLVTDVLKGTTPIDGISDAVIETMKQEVPTLQVNPGTEIADVLVETGLASSKTEARRFLAERAISINGRKVDYDVIQGDEFVNDRFLLRRGKAFKDTALIVR